jgi:hypothetical protein
MSVNALFVEFISADVLSEIGPFINGHTRVAGGFHNIHLFGMAFKL